MNPEKVGLFGAIIALAITAIQTQRDDPKQVEIHKDAEDKTNQLIEDLGIGGEEKEALEKSISELFLNASAARQPSEDNLNTVKKLFDTPEDFSTGASRAAERERRGQQPEHPPEDNPNPTEGKPT
jgi:hypothetical protein